MFDRFGIDFGAVLGSQMAPQGCHQTGVWRALGGPRRSQDRLGSVLFSSCRSGSLFWSSWAPLGVVFGRLGLLLGSFLAAPGVVLVLFRHFNSSIQPVNSSTRRFNSSTHQPMALRHFLTRPGGLRAARLNPPPPEGSERVQMEIEFLFEFFEFKESCQGPRSPHPPLI